MAIYDANDNILMRFTYADSRLPVAMQSGGNTYYLAYDQVGSLRIVTDTSGNVIKALDYDSFGNIIEDTNPSFDMPFGFAGGLYDPDTGLVRFGFREYSPEIGRWAAKDPISFDGGDTDLYGYCLSDPINCIDYWGLFVQVGSHPAIGIKGVQHAVIVLRPDNPADFINNPLFIDSRGRYKGYATLGGQPTGPVTFSTPYGTLRYKPNFPSDDPCHLTDFVDVKKPENMSDTDFINALINAANSYRNDAAYYPFPAFGYYNSNSFVSGVINAAGGTPPVLPGNHPGYDHPLPLP